MPGSLPYLDVPVQHADLGSHPVNPVAERVAFRRLRHLLGDACNNTWSLNRPRHSQIRLLGNRKSVQWFPLTPWLIDQSLSLSPSAAISKTFSVWPQNKHQNEGCVNFSGIGNSDVSTPPPFALSLSLSLSLCVSYCKIKDTSALVGVYCSTE